MRARRAAAALLLGTAALWAPAPAPAAETPAGAGGGPGTRIVVAPVPGAAGVAERMAAELRRHLDGSRFLAGRVEVRLLPEPVDPAAFTGLPDPDVAGRYARSADFLIGGTPAGDGAVAPFLVHLYALDAAYQSRQAAGRAPVVPPGHALPRFSADDPISLLYAVQGIVYARLGRHAAAFEVLSALNDFPDLAPEARRPVVFFAALSELMLGLDAGDGRRVDEALYHFGALAAAPGGADPALIGATYFNRGLGYQLHPERHGTPALDLAVQSYEAALPYFAAVPALKARLLHRLAAAEERYPPGPDGRHLRRAIDAYQRALAVWDPNVHPEAYRAALHNSAACYQRLPDGDREANLRQAIRLYERALRVPGLEARPELAAATFGNLGQAWQALPPDPTGDHLWRALAAYREALRYWTPARNPGQNRRLHQLAGQAYQSMPTGAPRENLTRALEHYDAALAATPKAEDPITWALLEFKRGAVLASLPPPGERLALARSRTAFTDALDVLTADKFPTLHAKVVQNLGRVEARLAVLDGGPPPAGEIDPARPEKTN